MLYKHCTRGRQIVQSINSTCSTRAAHGAATVEVGLETAEDFIVAVGGGGEGGGCVYGAYGGGGSWSGGG
jgi:hypothetical protein